MICELIKIERDVRRNSGISINGFEYNTSTTVVPYQATMIARNSEVCQLDGRLNRDTFDLSIAFANNSYLVKFWEQDSNIGTLKSVVSMVGKMVAEKSADAMYDTMLPKIFDANGNQVGELQYIPVKQENIQSYFYYVLQLNGVSLKCYIVGEKDGIYFCMYNSNEQMVATVSKNLHSKNGKSRYTMYIVSDDWFQYVAVMTSIIHKLCYEAEDIDHLGSQNYKLNTFQNGLLGKYDPNFIPQIVAREGAQNLPENMPLVQQKVQESQNTTLIKTGKIGWIIFLIAFIVIVACIFLFA